MSKFFEQTGRFSPDSYRMGLCNEILAERLEQIERGYTPDSDLAYPEIESGLTDLSLAAAAYVTNEFSDYPWYNAEELDQDRNFLSHRGRLVRAAALIMAEIERIDHKYFGNVIDHKYFGNLTDE